MAGKVGYTGEVGASYAPEEIASTEGLQWITVTIDTTTLDAANPDGSTDLRKYLTLARGGNGKYTQFSATDHTSSNIVILGENIYDIDNGDQVAKALWAGTFKTGVIIESDTVEWTVVQRIGRRDY